MGITLELPNTAPKADTEVIEATLPVSTMTAEAVQEEVKTELTQVEKLSLEEQQEVDNFARQINLHDSEMILRYGESTQQKLEKFTDGALQGVVGRDVGEIGKLLTEMTTNIKDFNEKAESKVIMFVRSLKKKTDLLIVKYSVVSDTLEKVKKELIGQRTTLLVDIKMLDKMYDDNLEYYKELTMYILAGHQALKETREGELCELRQKAEASGAQEDALLYSDLKDHCENFEKQLFDLELTRSVCLQTAPQIRLVQKTDEQLVRKIQSSINNTIPIWKQKIAIALAIQHNEEAAKVQKGITDLTSQMLEDNARQLHTSVAAAAREADRGVIDVQSIIVSNTELLATFDDIWAIQEEGCKARTEARVELRKAEESLKQKLLQASQRAKS